MHSYGLPGVLFLYFVDCDRGLWRHRRARKRNVCRYRLFRFPRHLWLDFGCLHLKLLPARFRSALSIYYRHAELDGDEIKTAHVHMVRAWIRFWALASRYDTHCIKAVSTGMTVGGLIAQGVAVAQNAGDIVVVLTNSTSQNGTAEQSTIKNHMRFSTDTFFVVVAAIQAVFIVMLLPIFRAQKKGSAQVRATVHRSPSVICVAVVISRVVFASLLVNGLHLKASLAPSRSGRCIKSDELILPGRGPQETAKTSTRPIRTARLTAVQVSSEVFGEPRFCYPELLT